MSGFYFTPKVANKTVTTAATRVALFSSETPAHVVTIQANSGNGGVIYVGDSTVSSTVYGVKLAAGVSYSLSCDGNDSKLNLADIYLDTSNSGDGASVLYI